MSSSEAVRDDLRAALDLDAGWRVRAVDADPATAMLAREDLGAETAAIEVVRGNAMVEVRVYVDVETLRDADREQAAGETSTGTPEPVGEVVTGTWRDALCLVEACTERATLAAVARWAESDEASRRDFRDVVLDPEG